MKIQNADQAHIPREKLQDYLLSEAHPVGRFKTKFFRSLGFERTDWRALKVEILSMLDNEAKEKERTEYGQKYEVRSTIQGPSGKRADVVSVWIILEGEDFPRFITAYPGET